MNTPNIARYRKSLLVIFRHSLNLIRTMMSKIATATNNLMNAISRALNPAAFRSRVNMAIIPDSTMVPVRINITAIFLFIGVNGGYPF